MADSVTREEYDAMLQLMQQMQEQIKSVQQQSEIQQMQLDLMRQMQEQMNKIQEQNEVQQSQLQTLYRRATTDTLTNVPNREGMNDYITGKALNTLQEEEPMSVIIFDIDKFKRFNDTYGHDVGDKCLKQVADTLRENIRGNSDSGIFRWGGEEFVIITPNDSERTAEIADRLRKAVAEKPFVIDENTTTQITVSGGVAEFVSTELSKETIIENFQKTFEQADTALYQAKENGRNQIQRIDALEINEKPKTNEGINKIMANTEFGLKEDDMQKTIDNCTNLMAALQIDSGMTEILKERVKDYLQEYGDWSNISKSVQRAYLDETAEIVRDDSPELTIEWDLLNDFSTLTVTSPEGATVNYRGQTKDELVHQLSGNDFLVVNTLNDEARMLVTNDFLVRLNEAMENTPYSISDYVSEMLESDNQSAYISIEDGNMTLILDFTNGEGAMRLTDDQIPTEIKTEIVDNVFPQIKGNLEFVQKFVDYADVHNRYKDEVRDISMDTIKEFLEDTIASEETAIAELNLAERIVQFLEDYTPDLFNDTRDKEYSDLSYGDFKNHLIGDIASDLERESGEVEYIKMIDSYNVIDNDKDETAERAETAEQLLVGISQVHQKRLEENLGYELSDKECLEQAISRSTNDPALPFTQYGRYQVTNELTFENDMENTLKSLLSIENVPTSLFTVDYDNQTAKLEVIDTELTEKELNALVSTYQNIIGKDTELEVVKSEQSFENNLSFDKAVVEKDGDIYRVGMDNELLQDVLNRAGFVNDGGNMDIYVTQQGQIMIDLVDRNNPEIAVPMTESERNSLSSLISEYEQGETRRFRDIDKPLSDVVQKETEKNGKRRNQSGNDEH